eukprot:3561650-Amphidinium_carterae.1
MSGFGMQCRKQRWLTMCTLDLLGFANAQLLIIESLRRLGGASGPTVDVSKTRLQNKGLPFWMDSEKMESKRVSMWWECLDFLVGLGVGTWNTGTQETGLWGRRDSAAKFARSFSSLRQNY